MGKSQQGLGGDGRNNDPSRLLHEVLLSIDSTLYQGYLANTPTPDPQQYNNLQESFSNSIEDLNTTLNPPPATSGNPKAMNFPACKITIGQWSYDAVFPDDIVVKIYFANKRLIWELIVPEETGTSNTSRQKKKIEIRTDDILSLNAKFHATDETGILEVELKKPPTFFVEINKGAQGQTLWKKIDQDFTQNQSSICRRHQLCFKPGVLQESLKKLVTRSHFWSDLFKVPFPLHNSLYFDSAYGNSSINSSYADNNINSSLTNFDSSSGDNIISSLTNLNSGYRENSINNLRTEFNIGHGDNNINNLRTEFDSGHGDNKFNHSLTYFSSGHGDNNINDLRTEIDSGHGDNNVNYSLTYFSSGHRDNNINSSLTYFSYENNDINNPLTYNHDQILGFNSVDNADRNHLFQGISLGHYPNHLIFESDLNLVGVDKVPDPVGVDEGINDMANQVLADDKDCVGCLLEVCSLHIPTNQSHQNWIQDPEEPAIYRKSTLYLMNSP